MSVAVAGHEAVAVVRKTTMTWLAVAIISAGLFVRLFHLDADPNYYEWVGYITDEGRWVQTARVLALHQPLLDQNRLHFAVAPLFQGAVFVVFHFFHVTMWSARMYAALSGGLLVAVFWLAMRRIVTAEAALLGAALLAFQGDLVALSRLAVPEVPAMLLELLVYVVLTEFPSRRGAFGAGLLTCVALGTKLTTAPLALIAPAIIFWARPASVPVRERLRNLAAYFVPLIVVGLVGITVFLVWFGPGILRSIANLVGLASLYRVVGFPFTGGFAWTVNVWALGLWISFLAVLAREQAQMSTRERTHLAASALWVGLYGALMLGLAYFPTRYRIHILVPLAINLCCGVSVLQRLVPSAIIDALKTRTGWQGLRRRLVLVVPTAVVLAFLFVPFSTLIGVPERLAHWVTAIAVCAGLLMAAAQLGRDSRRLMSFFLFFPLVSLAVVLLQPVVNTISPFVPPTMNPPGLAIAIALLAGMALLADVPHRSRWALETWPRLIVGLTIAVSAWSFAQGTTRYLDPQYSIKQSSIDIAELFASCASIGADRSEGLFNNNTLHYRRPLDEQQPSCFLVAFPTATAETLLASGYEPARTYSLFISPEYCKTHPRLQDSGCKTLVGAYIRPPRSSQ